MTRPTHPRLPLRVHDQDKEKPDGLNDDNDEHSAAPSTTKAQSDKPHIGTHYQVYIIRYGWPYARNRGESHEIAIAIAIVRNSHNDPNLNTTSIIHTISYYITLNRSTQPPPPSPPPSHAIVVAEQPTLFWTANRKPHKPCHLLCAWSNTFIRPAEQEI